MREHAEDELFGLRRGGAGGERCAEAALVLGEGALDLLAAMVDAPREAAPERATVARPGPAPTGRATVEADHRAPHAELLPTDGVLLLAVVAGVGDERVQALRVALLAPWPLGEAGGGGNGGGIGGGRLAHHGDESRRIVRRAPVGARPEDEVRGGVERDGELGMLRPAMAPARRAAGMQPRIRGAVARRVVIAVVRAHVARVEPRAVDGDRGAGGREEPAPRRGGEERPLDRGEGPPFSASARSRCAA